MKSLNKKHKRDKQSKDSNDKNFNNKKCKISKNDNNNNKNDSNCINNNTQNNNINNNNNANISNNNTSSINNNNKSNINNNNSNNIKINNNTKDNVNPNNNSNDKISTDKISQELNNQNLSENKQQEQQIQIPKLDSKQIKIEEVKEGKAHIHLCNKDKSFVAFYNPAQELNRDLTVASIFTYFSFTKYRKEKELKSLNQRKFSIIEPLSATGLRGIRYYKELPKEKITQIFTNDLDPKAVECIKLNMEENQADPEIFKIFQMDASKLMFSYPKNFDVIDLDPYGSAIPFLDSCVQTSKSGALLCITFTDMTVLCGNYPETTLYKYGSVPYKSTFCHEMAKRIALYSIATTASKYKRAIKPLFSYNAEFYVRLFLIIKDSPEECKKNALNFGYLFHCKNCQNRKIIRMAREEEDKIKNGKALRKIKFNNLIFPQEKCECCGSSYCMTGPYWTGDLFDEDWVKSLLATLKLKEFAYLKFNTWLQNICQGILNELPLKDQVFNLDYNQFSRNLNLSTFKLSIFENALEKMGYKFAQSYYDSNLFKTDAPVSVIYDILRQYKMEYFKDEYFKNVEKGTYNYNLLDKPIKGGAVFEEMTRTKVIKYPNHPQPNWGPKGRAK